jgi:hypothetical protein
MKRKPSIREGGATSVAFGAPTDLKLDMESDRALPLGVDRYMRQYEREYNRGYWSEGFNLRIEELD